MVKGEQTKEVSKQKLDAAKLLSSVDALNKVPDKVIREFFLGIYDLNHAFQLFLNEELKKEECIDLRPCFEEYQTYLLNHFQKFTKAYFDRKNKKFVLEDDQKQDITFKPLNKVEIVSIEHPTPVSSIKTLPFPHVKPNSYQPAHSSESQFGLHSMFKPPVTFSNNISNPFIKNKTNGLFPTKNRISLPIKINGYEEPIEMDHKQKRTGRK